MPGPSVHYIVGKQLFNGSRKTAENKYLNDETRNLIRENPTFLNFGTLGPDFLFFNVKDWPLGEFFPAKKLIRLAQTIKEIESKVEEAFPILVELKELKDEFDEAVDEIVDESATLRSIRSMINDTKSLIGLIDATISTALEDFVTSNINIYGLLSHPIQNCEQKNAWWWFDILHYRKSGKFAQYLLENSKHDPQLHSYAIGYLSHVAADSVGHPYVNNIVRGPFRTHSQRHNVVEKFQDVSALKQYEDKDFSNSSLHDEFRFNFSEHARIPDAESLIDGLTPEITDIGLPKDLCNLFSEATKEVFKDRDGNSIFEKHMEPEEVDAAYRLWYSWFKSSTEEAILPTSLPDLPPLTEELRRVYDDFIDQVQNAAGTIFDIFDDVDFSWNFDPSNIVNFFRNVARIIKELLKTAAALLDALLGAVATIGAHAYHHILNFIYQTIYGVYDYFRLSVSLNGLAFPSERYLDDPKIEHMLNPRLPDLQGNSLNNRWSYPLKEVDVSNGIFRTAPQEAHLVYPHTAPELDTSTPAPNSYTSESHLYFIEDDIGLDTDFVDGINEIRDFENLKRQGRSELLGNACELTGYLYEIYDKGGEIPDINLDADRGIGFPCWESESCDINNEITEPVQPIIKS